MAREDWKGVMIMATMVAEAEVVAEKRSFPNVTQYINDAVRRALDEDKQKIAADAQSAGDKPGTDR